jgi:hypothetical protein
MAIRPAARALPRPPSPWMRSGVRELEDSGEQFIRVTDWLAGPDPRDPTNERLAESLLEQNAGVLRDMAISGDVRRVRGVPGLQFRTGTRVGAIPILSPLTARPDFGLIVRPRFSWTSAGDMMASVGFRAIPELLPQLPLLPQSERRIPPWVLSSVILPRLERLLASLDRSFAWAQDETAIPRGAIDWPAYASRSLAVGRPLAVPCRWPDLREDPELLSAIHHAVRAHQALLFNQRTAGPVVNGLLARCAQMLARLTAYAPRAATPALRRAWHGRPMSRAVFRDGLEAIEWTVDERGLAGISDLDGIAWRMDMEVFFEAWVESIATRLASLKGGLVVSGRKLSSQSELRWTPSQLGSQTSLIPDVVVTRDDSTLILDAKYKRHAQALDDVGAWSRLPDLLRDNHRMDLLQVLAYAALSDAPRIVACLAYPVTRQLWEELRARGRTWTRALVRGGAREVHVAWCALPMGGPLDQPAWMLDEILAAGSDPK